MVNQKNGFDCPGCAWPDPEHRTSFEFCENGAKAVADEATKGKVGKSFFSKYSIQELSSKSDFWLNNQGRLIEPMYLDSSHTYAAQHALNPSDYQFIVSGMLMDCRYMWSPQSRYDWDQDLHWFTLDHLTGSF